MKIKNLSLLLLTLFASLSSQEPAKEPPAQTTITPKKEETVRSDKSVQLLYEMYSYKPPVRLTNQALALEPGSCSMGLEDDFRKKEICTDSGAEICITHPWSDADWAVAHRQFQLRTPVPDEPFEDFLLSPRTEHSYDDSLDYHVFSDELSELIRDARQILKSFIPGPSLTIAELEEKCIKNGALIDFLPMQNYNALSKINSCNTYIFLENILL